MAEPTQMTVREAKALAERLAGKKTGSTLAGQIAVLEADGRTAARLIHAMLRQVHSSDVFQLPQEEACMTDQDQARLAAIRAEYAPYDTFPEFEEGFAAHAKRNYRNPYPSSVAAQAWDRGLDAAARYACGYAPATEETGPDARGWLARFSPNSRSK